MRLDKYLTEMGIGTRSEVKKMIRQKRILCNDVCVTKPECKIDEKSDIIIVDGRTIVYEEFEYYMLHKPAGVVTAVTDNRDRTVMDLLDTKRKDLFPAGRLDKDTEGLLLITNDGELAHRLLSPSKHVDKTYFVRVSGMLTDELIDKFADGIDIGEKNLTRPSSLEILSRGEISEANLTIHEGKFHQVKRMFHAVGCEVLYLKRISFGNLVLDPELSKGEYRKLTENEVKELRSLV